MIIPAVFTSKDYYDDFNTYLDKYPGIDEYDPYQPEDDGFLNQVQDEIIEDKDVSSAFFFAYVARFKMYRMQQLILDQRNTKYSLLFAQYIPGADIHRLQQVVQTSGDLKVMTYFACLVKGAKKGKIENLILKSGRAKFAYMIIKHLGSSKVEKFKEMIIKSKRPRFLYELAKYLLTSRKEMAKIEKLIISSGSPTYLRLFARDIIGANIEKLEEAILETQNMVGIEKFAKAVPRSKLAKMSVLF
jgi:hypothetical protein